MNRRKFLRTSALSTAAIGLSGPFFFARGAASPNEIVTVAIMGARGRAGFLSEVFARSRATQVKSIFDVDHRPLEELATKIGEIQRSEEHTSELQSRGHLVCRLLLEKKKYTYILGL